MNTWTCPHCGLEWSYSINQCRECGYKKYETREDIT